MKTHFGILPILLALSFCVHQVNAEVPTVVVKPKATVSNSYSMPFSTGISAIDSFLAKLFYSPSTIQVPKFDEQANRLERATKAILPQKVQDNLVKDTQSRTITATSQICISNPKTGEVEKVDGERVTSDPDPSLNSLINGALPINATIISNLKPNTEGKYDLNIPKQVAGESNCNENTTGQQVNQKELKATGGGGSSGGLLQVISNWFASLSKKEADENSISATVSISTVMDGADSSLCSVGGCTKPDTIDSAANLAHPDQQGNIGGIANSMIPGSQQVEKKDGNTLSNGTNLAYQKAYGFTDHYDKMMCLVLPKSQQGSLPCGGNKKTIGACGTGELPDLTLTGSCSMLCNTEKLVTTSDYLTPLNQQSLPNGDLPQLAKDILNKAGEVFQVPPSLLLSTMVSEGSFEWPEDWQWTDENVKAWSICGGKMPACEDHAHPATNSKGAVGWIPYWFFNESDKHYDAVQKVDPSRTKELVDPCNFMDAIFALAKKLHKESGGATYPYTECWGHPLLMNGGPSTSCTWGEDRVTTAIRQYSGYCSQPDKNGNYPPQTETNNSFDRAINFFRAFTCGSSSPIKNLIN